MQLHVLAATYYRDRYWNHRAAEENISWSNRVIFPCLVTFLPLKPSSIYCISSAHLLSFERQDWPSTFVQVSYEVGGDVFSLQELEHCVLRGRLPRPNLKDLPKRFAPLPPENDHHYMYKLGKVGRINRAHIYCLAWSGAMYYYCRASYYTKRMKV